MTFAQELSLDPETALGILDRFVTLALGEIGDLRKQAVRRGAGLIAGLPLGSRALRLLLALQQLSDVLRRPTLQPSPTKPHDPLRMISLTDAAHLTPSREGGQSFASEL
jgi:hypothetical protein